MGVAKKKSLGLKKSWSVRGYKLSVYQRNVFCKDRLRSVCRWFLRVGKGTYCVLRDDVGAVRLLHLLESLGGAEHMQQLLHSVLQQVVHQGLEQGKLGNGVLS